MNLVIIIIFVSWILSSFGSSIIYRFLTQSIKKSRYANIKQSILFGLGAIPFSYLLNCAFALKWLTVTDILQQFWIFCIVMIFWLIIEVLFLCTLLVWLSHVRAKPKMGLLNRFLNAYAPIPIEPIADDLNAEKNNHIKSDTHPKILRRTLWLIVLCVLFEVCLFNFRHFQPLIHPYPQAQFSVDQMIIQNTDSIGVDNKGKYVMGRNNQPIYVELPNVNMPVFSIYLDADQEGAEAEVSFKIKEDAYANNFREIRDQHIIRDNVCSHHFLYVSAGNCRELAVEISINKPNDSVLLRNIIFNAPVPFMFSPTRLLLLILFIAGTYFVVKKKAWQIKLQEHNQAQKITINMLMVLLIGIGMFTSLTSFSFEKDSVVWSKEKAQEEDYYSQMTVSLEKGQVYLDEEPYEFLSKIDNPYDYSQRDNKGYYLWDSAYYKGKYYSYYGITPVITLLLPFHYLNGNFLNTTFAGMIFGLFAILFILLFYQTLIRKWYPNTSFLLFLLGLVGIGICTYVLWLMRRMMFYELAIVSGACYSAMGLYFVFSGALAEKIRPWKLALGGLSLALAVGCRPLTLLLIVAVAPILLSAVAKQMRISFKKAILTVLAFLVPYAMYGAFLMWYNIIRFDSIIEFGATYQLTVYDVHYYHLFNYPILPLGIWNYYLQPIHITPTFPFIHVAYIPLYNTNNYYYQQAMAGILNMPMMWSLFGIPFVYKSIKNKDRVQAHTMISFLLTAIVISYLCIMLAGGVHRYTMDFIILFITCAILVLFEIYNRAQRNRQSSHSEFYSISFLLILSVMIAFSLSIGGEAPWFAENNHHLFYQIAKTWEFWR